MITLENVSAGYLTAAKPIVAVDDVTLTINDNEILGIAGESGCGKTTLLKFIYGQIGNGLKMFGGHAKWRSSSKDAAHPTFVDVDEVKSLWWDRITYIPQVVNILNPVLRIDEQVMDSIPPRLMKSGRGSVRLEITALFEKLGLSADVLSMYPYQLSGGMIQRVLIALAAFPKPSLILADEPTTALDVVVQKRILILLQGVQRELQNSLVFVSHDLGVHYQISDRIAICYAGKVVEVGPTKAIFEHPYHPYTRALIDALPRVNDSSRRQGLDGRPPSLASPPAGCRFAARCQFAQDICRNTEPAAQTIGQTTVACHFPLGSLNG